MIHKDGPRITTTMPALRSAPRPVDDTWVTPTGPQAEARTDWVCLGCRTRVPFADDTCPACGRGFGDGLGLDRRGRGVDPVRSTRRWLVVLRELVVLNLLFVLWRVVGHLATGDRTAAVTNGRSVWDAERWLHLPSEAAVQRPVLATTWLLRAADDWYAWAHAGAVALVLVWLLVRHRDAYARWRTRFVAVTGIALLAALAPVAPPRLVPGLGLVDVAARLDQSVYTSSAGSVSDQLSAMPSVHIAWALLVTAVVVTVSRSRWRWLAVLYPAVTLWVVVVTANHYWLDAVAATALTAAVVATDRLVRRRRIARRGEVSPPLPGPRVPAPR